MVSLMTGKSPRAKARETKRFQETRTPKRLLVFGQFLEVGKHYKIIPGSLLPHEEMTSMEHK